jgi:hypothetical protein
MMPTFGFALALLYAALISPFDLCIMGVNARPAPLELPSSLPIERPDAVGVPHCFAGDVFVPSANLGGVQRGDPLFIQHAGAYCFAVANHLNGKLGPSHMTVDNEVVVRRSYAAEDGFCDHAVLGHNGIRAFNTVEGEAVAEDERCPTGQGSSTLIK